MTSPNSYGLPVVITVADHQRQVQQNAGNALVDLSIYIPDIVLDIRYATAANILGEAVYDHAAAYLRRPVATALRAVQRYLRKQGLGLKIFDAYRPYSTTVRFYEKIRDETYAAPPWRGSRHNRGCSVDVALVELATGSALPMPTDFDDLSPAAHTGYAHVPEAAARNRALLVAAMTRQNFINYPGEWWHFDHARWAEFDLLDLDFAMLRNTQNELP